MTILGGSNVGRLHLLLKKHSSGRLRRIMLAKSWNYAFMDSRIMLVKSSLLCFGTRGYIFTLLYLYLWSLKVREIVPFFVLASCKWPFSTTKYICIPIPRCPSMLEINMEKTPTSKEKTLLLLFNLRTACCFVLFELISAAQRNEAEPDSNGNINFQSGPNVPCQSAQTDKSVSSA